MNITIERNTAIPSYYRPEYNLMVDGIYLIERRHHYYVWHITVLRGSVLVETSPDSEYSRVLDEFISNLQHDTAIPSHISDLISHLMTEVGEGLDSRYWAWKQRQDYLATLTRAEFCQTPEGQEEVRRLSTYPTMH